MGYKSHDDIDIIPAIVMVAYAPMYLFDEWRCREES
jgi:hypothetical protein